MKIDHNFAYAYFLLVLSILGCHRQPDNAIASPSTSPSATSQKAWSLPAPSAQHNLTIYGYNYTDLPISSFSADGNGGGNLHVSTPTSSGGSSVCCYTFYGDAPSDQYYQPYPVKVRWLTSIERREDAYWCEQDVPLKGPIPANPNYLEVHFYQDGHIEIAVTEQMSSPRLKLPVEDENTGTRYAELKKNVNNAKQFASCERWLMPGSVVANYIKYTSYSAAQAVVAHQKGLDAEKHIKRSKQEYHELEQQAYNTASEQEEARIRKMNQDEYVAYEQHAREQEALRDKAEEEARHQEFLELLKHDEEARKRNGQK